MAAFLLAVLAGCGGSGGGGGPALPRAKLAGVAFVGAGTTPVAGDRLILFMTQDVVLSGALFDDQDVQLSSGSLGTVGTAPTLLSSRMVQINLGAGVSLLPGTTTLSLSPQNNAFRDATGGFPAAGTTVTVTDGDGDSPSITALTLSGVAFELNGSGGAGGTLQVPRTGFTIDVTHTDPTSAVNPAATLIQSNKSINTPAGFLLAGDNLTSFLTEVTVGSTSTFTLPGNVVLSDGASTITVTVVDSTGMFSNQASFNLLVRNLDPSVRPFDPTVNATQLWFLDRSRDLESYTHNTGQPLNPIVVNGGANGRPDLEDLYFIVGLFGGVGSVNNTVRSQIENALTTQLASLFNGINVTFTLTSPGTFPGTSAVPYANSSFSQICIAGAESPAGNTGVLGVALFDPHNNNQDNDCLIDFGGSQRLGVFVHTLVNSSMATAPVSTFRSTYDAFTPGFGGTPIGDAGDGLDPGRLAGTTTDARATAISNAISRMARAIAVVTAHECGHSMGLVQDGAMPNGLYGGDANNFPGSSSGHILNIFLPSAQNVMSPAMSFDVTLSTNTRFNSLNAAYLRERVIYN